MIDNAWAWYDPANQGVIMICDDQYNPCADCDSYVRRTRDKITTPNRYWSSDNDRPVIEPHPDYDGAIRFRIDSTEFTGIISWVPGMGLDAMTLTDITAIAPHPICGDDATWDTTHTEIASSASSCWTFFSAFKVNSIDSPYPTVPSSSLYLGPTLSGNGYIGLQMQYNQVYQTPILMMKTGISNTASVTTPLPLGEIAIAEGVRTVNGNCLWLNGQYIGTSATSSWIPVYAGLGGAPAGTWVDSFGGVHRHPWGDYYIYESIIYNRALNAYEREVVRDYLASKWGGSVVHGSGDGQCEVCGAPGTTSLRRQATLIGAN